MAGTIQCGRRSRKDFGKIPSIVEIPNLIEVQKRSYETFLQKDVPADRREEIGLQAVFKSVFPIADYNDNALLEFDSYHFGDPKYTVEECHDRGMTFAIPLKVTLRLVVFDHDKEAKTKTRARRWPRASRSSRRGSFRTAARGWSSTSTPTTCCTSASTGGARCTRPLSCAPSTSSRRARFSPTRRSSRTSTTSRTCWASRTATRG